ncbi:MAG: hypothetical protein II795_02975, partial [Firmicutes bacterium]|nr:hypothetical protein [Bacillota bacterium]
RNLIMLWSGRGPKGYAMGSAVSKNGILGPWKQNEKLAFEEDGGHGMVFKDWSGKYFMTVHQPNKTPSERPVLVPATVKGGVITIQSVPSKVSVKAAAGTKTAGKDASKNVPEAVQKEEKKKDELPVWLL